MSSESFIIETVSSKWLRFPNGFQKATCIVDLPNDFALNINSNTGKIEVHEKKADGVYKLVGNIKMGNTTKIKPSSSDVSLAEDHCDPSTQETSETAEQSQPFRHVISETANLY